MILRFYSVKDIVAGSYMNPVPLQNDNVAKRSLAIAGKNVNNENSQFKDNWRDIQLWYLFSLDTDSGLVVDNVPNLIGDLASYVEVDPDEYK